MISKKRLLFILLFLPVFLIVFWTGFSYLACLANNNTIYPVASESKELAGGDGENSQLPPSINPKLPRLEKPLTILIVGIDKASSIGGYVRPEPWRADVIILARVDPGVSRVSLLSIPRDTIANIPGHGAEKIAHAHAYGEIPLTITTVEEFLGIKVNHFVSIDFATFARMVDIIGGIEINVQKELQTKHFHFLPGRQLLNGKQAYEYVTNRDEPMADIARIDRQQHFLKVLLKNVCNQGEVLDYARLYLEFKKNSETSLALSDILKLALFAREIKTDEMLMHKLPGRPEYINGISYWVADRDSLQKVRIEMFSEKN